MVSRPSKTKYYLDIAASVAARSTCIRRQYGAVIVKNDVIVSTGYNGSARGCPNCCDVGSCYRQLIRDTYQAKKRSKREIMQRNAALNAANKRRYNSRG